MDRVYILSLCLASGTAFALSPEERAAADSYVRWGFASLPIAFGLGMQGITLAVIAKFIRDCLGKGTYASMSGFPLIGPIFICLGLWRARDVAPWVFFIPWGVEFLAGIAAIVVRKATRATLAQSPVAGK